MKSIKIVMLYPKEMNIYGDFGNLLVLKKRLAHNDIASEIVFYEPGTIFPKDADIIIGGGGQDSGQDKIKDDLKNIKDEIKTLANNNTPMLLICGMYQLFGNYYKKSNGEEIKGLEIFDLYTNSGEQRNIGNITTENKTFEKIIGYENHSGLTFLNSGQESFSKVVSGFGNNDKDETEGARYKNVIGTYMHGPLLPKNSRIADEMIKIAVLNKYSTFSPKKFDDTLEDKAREVALNRKR